MRLEFKETAVINEAIAMIEAKALKNPEVFNNTHMLRKYFKLRIGHLAREVFEVAFLSANLELISCETLFQGSLTKCHVHYRELFRRGLELNAHAIVLAHNHPDVGPKPSPADIKLTKEIKGLADMLEFQLLDHIIVSVNGEYSFVENKLL